MNSHSTPTPASESRLRREIVRPQESLKSVIWDGTAAQVVDLSPEETAALSFIDEGVLRRVNIANGDLQSVTSLELHRDLCKEAARFASAPRGEIELIAFAVMASWLADRTWVTPRVVITTPTREELLPVGLFLYAVCRNALLIDKPASLLGLSTTEIWYAPSASHTEVDRFIRPDIKGIDLFAGERTQSRGAAFALGSATNETGAVHIHLGHCPLVVPSRFELEEISLDFQPRLLAHRMRLLSCNPTIPNPVSTLPYGLALQVRALQAATDNQQQQTEIARLSETRKDVFLDEVLLSVRGAVSETLFIACHQQKCITCGELAAAATELLAERQEPCLITARRVGSELRQLGLSSKAIEGGRGIQFDPDVKSKIHAIALELELPSTRLPREGCATCGRLNHSRTNPKLN